LSKLNRLRDNRLRENAPIALLVVAMAVAAAVLLSYASGLTYFQDSWEFLMHRRDPSVDAFLNPHNEHIVLIPVAVEQLFLRLFGMDSPLPEFVLLTALLLATAALVFLYVRRRLGPWPALFAATLLLFLGPAWQDLLWPFQIGFVGSACFGVATLLALENNSRRWDLAARGFLVLAVGFSSLGIPFVVAAFVDVLQKRRLLGLRRLFVPAVPLALYGIWWLGWGHRAESHFSVHHVLVSPRYVTEGFTSSLDALLALATIANEAVGRSQWALPLLALLVGLVVYGQISRPGVSPRLWPVLAAAATFWFLAAFNEIPGREPYSSRYLYVGALFLLLIGAELLWRVRFRREALLVGGVLTIAVVGFNLVPLREGRDFFRSQTTLTRSDLAAIEIAQRSVDPAFGLSPEIAGTPFLNEITAGEYLRAVSEYGSPAYTPAELEAADPSGRQQADLVLANALPVSIEPAPAGASLRDCRRVRPVARAPLALKPGVTLVRVPAGEAATIRLRRFSTSTYPLADEAVEAGTTTQLTVPADAARRPWSLLVEAGQGALACR
jgi:hypothetical protein